MAKKDINKKMRNLILMSFNDSQFADLNQRLANYVQETGKVITLQEYVRIILK